MDFALNDEQKMMIDTIRRFIAEELRPLEDPLENTGALPEVDARRIHAKAKELGLYALNMPAELGGGGLTNLDRILCEEQFGHTSDMLIRRAFGNVYEPLLHCKGEQVGRWLKPAVEGKRTCAITITESGATNKASGCSTAASTSSATASGPISSSSLPEPTVQQVRKRSACSWSTKACPVSPSARTR
jgi:acyl-CoA dehydrogenase